MNMARGKQTKKRISLVLEGLRNLENREDKAPPAVPSRVRKRVAIDVLPVAKTAARAGDFCCTDFRARINALLEGRLDEDVSQLVEDHLAECSACEDVFLREVGSSVFQGMRALRAQAPE